MIEKLLEYLENKSILILGFGIEGQSTYHFLRKHFPEKKLCISDRNLKLIEEHPELTEDIYLEVVLGEDYLNCLDSYDLIIKAPGISLKDLDVSNILNKITSQLGLFLEYINVYSIGITGTKGKSTTSTMMYKILKDQGKETFLLGNIGIPIFEELEELTPKSIVVIELSSHALEFVKSSPNIAILLNIYEEHLDHYLSMEKYIDAKFNIAKYQDDSDYFIYNYDNEFIKKHNFKYKKNDYAISLNDIEENVSKIVLKNNKIYCNDVFLCDSDIKMNLQGMHIVNNIMFLFAVCNILNLDIFKALKTIEKFEPLEHRMEYVGRFNNIEFYNDSIATIPEATINSIKAIKNINTIIIGGKDRGVNLKKLIEFLKKTEIENIICLPKTGEYIYDSLKNTEKKCYYTESLEEAVKIAKRETKENKVCLLSPAASSYGFFKNFEERGKLYKKYVNQ